MKPKELVSEETLQGIVLQEMKNSDIQGSDVYWLAMRVARAALEELGVVRVIDIAETAPPPHWIGGVDVKEALRNGAVLVRAKEMKS